MILNTQCVVPFGLQHRHLLFLCDAGIDVDH